MEIEQIRPKIIGKKLWNTVKIVLYMVRKSIMSKNKLMLDLQLALQVMLKRGKLAGKALTNLMIHHHYSAALTCRSNDAAATFFSGPHEYEFSCGNSPAAVNHSNNKLRKYHRHGHGRRESKIDDADFVRKVFEILNEVDGSSPAVALPGFGRTPTTVRQLRVTDSPFPLKDLEDSRQVDNDAEEFIKKFYKNLEKQRKIAALECPSPFHLRQSSMNKLYM